MGCASSHQQPSIGDGKDTATDGEKLHALLSTPAASAEQVHALRKNLRLDGWLHISSTQMVALLKHFGALVPDVRRVADPKTSPHSELWFNEPQLPWKKTQASRYILRKPYETSNFEGCDAKSTVVYEVSKEQVDFADYWEDSASSVRSWHTLPEWYGTETNSVYMAYQRLAHCLIDPAMPASPGCVDTSDLYMSDHFCIRINKKPEDSSMAQPSPEGVHQDGSDIIMISFMNRENVDPSTGQSRIWTMDQPSGPYPEEEFASIRHKCLTDMVMSEPFETLLAIDSLVKHEARSIKPVIKDLPCSRDVIVQWTRTARISGCDTLGVNSGAVAWDGSDAMAIAV